MTQIIFKKDIVKIMTLARDKKESRPYIHHLHLKIEAGVWYFHYTNAHGAVIYRGGEIAMADGGYNIPLDAFDLVKSKTEELTLSFKNDATEYLIAEAGAVTGAQGKFITDFQYPDFARIFAEMKMGGDCERYFKVPSVAQINLLWIKSVDTAYRVFKNYSVSKTLKIEGGEALPAFPAVFQVGIKKLDAQGYFVDIAQNIKKQQVYAAFGDFQFVIMPIVPVSHN